MTTYHLINRSNSGYIGDAVRYDVQVVSNGMHLAWLGPFRGRQAAIERCQRNNPDASVVEWNGSEWAPAV